MLRSMKRTRCNKGFSLVELIVVIAIMAILVGVAVPVYSMYIEKSQISSDKTTVGSIVRTMEIAGKGGTFSFADVEQAGTNGLQIPLGFIMITNEPDSNGNYVQILKTDDDTVNANADTIEKILTEAYGTDYAKELKLQSDTWNDSTIPTLFSQADEVFGKVQTLSNLLYTTSQIPVVGTAIANKLDKNANYTSGADIVYAVAKGVTAMDQETFVGHWMNANTEGINAAFGLGTKTTEYYAAARRAYNEAFAAYINANSDHSQHATAIAQCGEGIANITVPKTICKTMFETDTIKANWYSSEGLLNDQAQQCTDCKTLYEKYHQSEECRQNAIAFYKAMVTIAETGRDDNGETNLSNYNDYVKSFSALYKNVETAFQNTDSESVVVLTLYLQNGIVVTDASPMRILEN